IDQLVAQPALCPKPHFLDHGEELAAGVREVVLEAAARGALPLDDAGELQLLEAAGEERGGHARHAALQLVEAHAAEQQLANDQRRPALRQHLGGERDRAELPVSFSLAHARKPNTGGAAAASHFAVVGAARRRKLVSTLG